jgi:hypothetical protein
LERIKGDLVSDVTVHPRLEKRLRELLGDGFEIALQRQVGHVSDSTWRSARETLLGRKEGVESVVKLESSVGEEWYKKYQDKLTRVLRVLALSEIGRGGGLRSGRVAEGVGFSGGNKIVGVLRLTRKENGGVSDNCSLAGEGWDPRKGKTRLSKAMDGKH